VFWLLVNGQNLDPWPNKFIGGLPVGMLAFAYY